MHRLVLLVPIAALALPGVGCTGPDPAGTVEMKTGGGHVLDGRAWAVGTPISISAEGQGLGAAALRFESEEEVVRASAGSAYPSIPSPFSIFDGPFSRGYLYAEGDVVAEGDFDVVVGTPSGEIERVPMRAETIEGYELGVVLDDCPEYADFVFEGDPALLEGSRVTLTPAPVDGDGNPLLGRVDVRWDTELGADEGWGWYGADSPFLSVVVDAAGAVTMTIDGEDHRFEIAAASADEIEALRVLAMDEKHGAEDQSLLSAVGLTADGRVVHGLVPTWSTGGTSQTIYAANGSEVEACFGGTCAVWTGE